MSKYLVAGRSLATAATADHCAAQIWNPSGTKSIFCNAIAFFHTVGTADNAAVIRSSARGATPTATSTPDLDNDYQRQVTPDSAFVLELGTFGTQPTLQGPYMFRTNFGAAVGAGVIVPFGEDRLGIEIPPGTGLCIATPQAAILQPLDVSVWVTD